MHFLFVAPRSLLRQKRQVWFQPECSAFVSDSRVIQPRSKTHMLKQRPAFFSFDVQLFVVVGQHLWPCLLYTSDAADE